MLYEENRIVETTLFPLFQATYIPFGEFLLKDNKRHPFLLPTDKLTNYF